MRLCIRLFVLKLLEETQHPGSVHLMCELFHAGIDEVDGLSFEEMSEGGAGIDQLPARIDDDYASVLADAQGL